MQLVRTGRFRALSIQLTMALRKSADRRGCGKGCAEARFTEGSSAGGYCCSVCAAVDVPLLLSVRNASQDWRAPFALTDELLATVLPETYGS